MLLADRLECYWVIAMRENMQVDAGNTVIMVEHDMQVASNSDWVSPGAGDEGGLIVAQGVPAEVAKSTTSRTAPFLSARF